MTSQSYQLLFTKEAAQVLADLASSAQYATKLKKVNKALGPLQRDPRYPALNSHRYSSLHGSNEEVWDFYRENPTPSVWRIFGHQGPRADVLTVVTIGPHP